MLVCNDQKVNDHPSILLYPTTASPPHSESWGAEVHQARSEPRAEKHPGSQTGHK